MVRERGIEQGTILYDSYIVESVIGEGGFGITYLAVRRDSGEKVAVKEYFPVRFAVRQEESSRIAVADRDKKEYDRGKLRFMKEASILKEFRYLQGIVKVWDYFEANNTAYIIMDYIDGVTLKEYIASHGVMPYPELMEMMSPILKSLATLHRHGIIHRDISPDNLMIGMDNSLYLIDFGSVREMEYGKTTTVLLKAGYAPPEQYLRDGELGAWTDVYALCATIYTALCGRTPTDAIARLQGEELIPISKQDGMLEQWQWNAISKGMSMRSAERFRDMEELYDALTVEPTEEDIPTEVGLELKPQFQDGLRKLNGTKKHPIRFVGIAVFLVCIMCAVIYFGDSEQRKQNRNQSVTDETKSDTAATTEEDTSNTTQEKITSEEAPKLCRMPDVAGLNQDVAVTRITDVDGTIRVRITRRYSSQVARNVVIDQNVEPDTQYNEGSIEEIVLTVSEGAAPVTESQTEAPVSETPVTETSVTEAGTTQDSFDVKSDGNESVDFYLGD